MGWLSPARKDLLQIGSGERRYIDLSPFGDGGSPNLGAIYPGSNYANYARNGYSRNELVYACIRYRAESFPQAVVRVYDTNSQKQLDDHRLRRLFERPNPVTNEFEFFELSSVHKDIAGHCYWLVVKGRDGLPGEIWPLRPDLVGVRPNPGNLADFDWIYRPDPNRPEVEVAIPDAGSPRAARSRDFIIRVRYPNPNTDDVGWRYFGVPPLRAAARAVSQDNAATDFVEDLLSNYAMPATVITSQQEIDDVMHRRLQARWRQAFGKRNRGRPAFLEKGMTVETLTMNLKDLTFPDLRTLSETRICGAFGVEPILVGAKIGLEHNAYKDYHEARLSFWEEAMLSEQRRFIEPIRSYLAPYFMGAGRRSVRPAWDNSEVPAFKESQGTLWQRATLAFQTGGITRNEFRSVVGLPPVDGGDVFHVPTNVAVTEVGASPTPVSADVEITAAEFGIQLSPDEVSQLRAIES